MERKLGEIRQTINNLHEQPNVTVLSEEEASFCSRRYATKTTFGNYNYVSSVKTLSTALTVYIGGKAVETGAYTQKKKDIRKSALSTIKSVNEYLLKAPIVEINCTMGDGSSFSPKCRMFLSTYRKENIRIADMVSQTLFPGSDEFAPDLIVVFVPEWPEKERQILVLPEVGVTYILGTDYFGEAKNAFLRMAMWAAKQQSMLGLHAGTKILRAKSEDGRLRKLGMIMFGITATGKTTHSCHNHDLNLPGEGVEIVQDDVIFWREDGSAIGSERGFYIKTDGLTPETQPLLYNAAIQKNAILENVMVDYKGNADFEDRKLTANGHGIVQHTDLGSYACKSINMPPIDDLDGLIIAFMVRNYTVIPIVSKLTPEQATAAYMLSESIDTAASDQQKMDTLSGGIGASPLLIGNVSDDCNRFYELLKAHSDKIECYMLNTGGVGELVEHGLDGARKVKRKVTRVQIPEMSSIIRGVARGTIKWHEDSNWMVETPEYVDGLDISKFDPILHYNQHKIDSLIATIRVERAAYAEQFSGLMPEIRNAMEF